MLEKFKIGNSVKKISANQIMMIVTVILSKDYSRTAHADDVCFNGKYKCAWVKNSEAFSDEFVESDLMFA